MKKISVANQKGGQGKTTLTVHLAYRAREVGLRVLLVDMDRQGSLSLSFPSVEGAASGVVASALYVNDIGDTQPEYLDAGFAIIRADKRLSLFDDLKDDLIKNPANNLRKFAGDFDLCLIDSPGGLGTKLYSALAAADVVVCPVSVGLYEMAALGDLFNEVKAVKSKGYNPKLRLMGLIPNKVNTKSAEEVEAIATLRQRFGAAIMPITLAERASVKQAIMRRRPVWIGTKGASHSAAAKEWKNACNEILVNLGSIKK